MSENEKTNSSVLVYCVVSCFAFKGKKTFEQLLEEEILAEEERVCTFLIQLLK